ncbi:MAG: glycosyltransferase family 2 protein, partial [Chloroflexota bacterium]|nr:glycosyltransferase family 2 protein [Chloroflexota bacterium]
RPPLRPLADAELPASDGLPTVSVVVPARDEAAVLPQLVADVAAQDHRDGLGRPRFELLVVDDRSTDGSAAAVRRAASQHGLESVTRVVRRGPPEAAGPEAVLTAALPDGKGAALTAAPPECCAGEIVAVLDADARVAPDFLRRVATYFARGAQAMTARRRIVCEGHAGLAGHFAAAQDDEQTADGEIQRGRWSLGGCSEFRGNGILVRRDRLADVGGWRADALCEDLDLASRLAAGCGIRVGWGIDIVVWEEPVVRPGPFWRQRCRWAEGIVRRQLMLTAPVLRTPKLSLRAKLDYLAYSAQTLLPLSIVGAVVGALLFRDWRPAARLSALYLATGTILAADALRWTPDASGRPLSWPARLGRALRVTVFSAHWLAVFPVGWARVAVGRGPVRYTKMEHVGAPASWRPGAP